MGGAGEKGVVEMETAVLEQQLKKKKIKQQGDITSHLSEWPSLINQQTTSPANSVKEREP